MTTDLLPMFLCGVIAGIGLALIIFALASR